MAPELPEGLRWLPGWLAPGEATALFELLLRETPWEDQVLQMGGRLVPMPRRTAFFGPHAYAYSGLLHPACALPPRLDAMRARIEQACRHPFNTLLMNLYRDGADSVSWHSDDDYPHGGHPAVAR
jgi:alkylated DNA repair dioxygenase AlkB